MCEFNTHNFINIIVISLIFLNFLVQYQVLLVIHSEMQLLPKMKATLFHMSLLHDT